MNSIRCSQCEHYIEANAGEGKIYGCDRSRCVFEPTTKNDLGVDCISRQATINAVKRIHPVDTDYDCTLYDKVDVMYVLDEMPSVTPQEPFINKPCISSGVCEHDKNKVLDKIRTEILEEHENAYAREDNDVAYGLSVTLDIIDKYKVEQKR